MVPRPVPRPATAGLAARRTASDVLTMPLGPLTGSSGLLRRVGSSARQHKAQ
jgi:hypothetical protein